MCSREQGEALLVGKNHILLWSLLWVFLAPDDLEDMLGLSMQVLDSDNHFLPSSHPAHSCCFLLFFRFMRMP